MKWLNRYLLAIAAMLAFLVAYPFLKLSDFVNWIYMKI